MWKTYFLSTLFYQIPGQLFEQTVVLILCIGHDYQHKKVIQMWIPTKAHLAPNKDQCEFSI